MNRDSLYTIIPFLTWAESARLRSSVRYFPELPFRIKTNDDDSISVIDRDGNAVNPFTFAVENEIPELLRWLVKQDEAAIVNTILSLHKASAIDHIARFVRSPQRFLEMAIILDDGIIVEKLLDVFYYRISHPDAMDLAIRHRSYNAIDALFDNGYDTEDATQLAFYQGRNDMVEEFVERFGIDYPE